MTSERLPHARPPHPREHAGRGLASPPLREPGSPAERRGARLSVAVLLLGLVAPWAVCLDGLGWGDADGQTRWTRELDARARAHVATLTSPKVLVVGGSSVLFGIDAASLSARLGHPVVAYGLHAGMGIDVITELAVPLIREGDTVVFAPELAGFYAEADYSQALRGDWLVSTPTAIRDPVATFPLRPWYAGRERLRRFRAQKEWSVVQAYIDARIRALGYPRPLPPFTPYELEALDAAGRLTFPRPTAPSAVQDHSPSALESTYDFANSRGARAARLLVEACRARGARLFVMPGMRVLLGHATPAYADGVRLLEERWMRDVEALGARRLLDPGSTALPAEFGYDTTNHLNDRGIDELEPRLEHALRSALALPPR